MAGELRLSLLASLARLLRLGYLGNLGSHEIASGVLLSRDNDLVTRLVVLEIHL